MFLVLHDRIERSWKKLFVMHEVLEDLEVVRS